MLKKWKIFVNYQKEEKWINDMAKTGYHLTNYTFGRYTFEKGEPGKFEYRIEFLDENPSTQESMEYLEFMDINGIECVDTYFQWVYFRKEATDEPFEIYSDYESQIMHMKRVIGIILAVSMANLFIAIFNTFLGSMNTMSVNISYIAAIIGWIVFIFTIIVYMKYRKNFKELKEGRNVHD